MLQAAFDSVVSFTRSSTTTEFGNLNFLPRDAYISAAYAIVQCLSVMFVYYVETAKDTAIVAMECE